MTDAPDFVLPASLAERISEAQRQTIVETPRGQRLKLLSSALGIDEPQTLIALAAAACIDTASNLEADNDSLSLLPARLVHDYQLVPIVVGAKKTDDATPDPAAPLHLATAWPPEPVMGDWIRTFTSRPLVWHLGVPEKIHHLILQHFGVGSGSLEGGDEDYVAPETLQQADADVDEDAAVVRFVTDVITQAVNDEATDIHFEPQETQLNIRYRVDGLLVQVPVPENLRRFQDAIISRLKIMAKLNISEKRLPQDGRINFRAGANVLDIRVATAPTIYAESVSLRLLNQKKEIGRAHV